MLECQGESNAVRTACSQPEDGRGPAPLGSSTAQHARTGRSRPRLHSSPLRRSSSRREPTRASSSRRRRKRGPTSNPTSLGAACERPPPYSPPTRTHLRPYDNESRDLSGRGVLLLLLLLSSDRAAGAGVVCWASRGLVVDRIRAAEPNQSRGRGHRTTLRRRPRRETDLNLVALVQLDCPQVDRPRPDGHQPQDARQPPRAVQGQEAPARHARQEDPRYPQAVDQGTPAGRRRLLVDWFVRHVDPLSCVSLPCSTSALRPPSVRTRRRSTSRRGSSSSRVSRLASFSLRVPSCSKPLTSRPFSIALVLTRVA